MKTFPSRFATAALLAAAILGLSVVPAHAQGFRVRQWGVYAPGINPNAPFYNQANPFQYVAPGVSLQSALINTMHAGQAASFVPPWLYGYNPYPPINFGPAYQFPGYSPFLSGGGGYGSPFLTTGYGGGGYGYGGSPFLSTGGLPDYGSTLSTGYSPYAPYVGSGGRLMGAADVIFSEGRFMMDQEQARLLRTKWKAAELDYKKKLFDYNEYVRANTPTFAETREKLDASILRRMQKTASDGEIWSGKSQNILLKDFAKHQGQKVDLPELKLPEDVLRQINVSATGASMAALRNGGELNWPLALAELAPTDKKRDMDLQAKELYRQAEQTGKADPATVKDLKTNIRKVRDLLVSKVNDIPTEQYADSKEFLNNIEAAIRAVESGDAASFFEYQKFVRGGNRTVQELIEFMNQRGFSFAPAVSGADYAAYQALYQALAVSDVAMNEQLRSTVTTRK
jgi:hypothetical protein